MKIATEQLWALARDFANKAGHCQRSDRWHEEETCITCQELVNFARAAIALNDKPELHA